MWGDEASLDAAQRRVDKWESSLAEHAAKAKALSVRLSRLTAAAHTKDRLVAVTVDSSHEDEWWRNHRVCVAQVGRPARHLGLSVRPPPGSPAQTHDDLRRGGREHREEVVLPATEVVVMKTYGVQAVREGKFWLLTVPELDVMTQARRLTEAEEMARDLIATWLDIAPESFAVDLDVALPDELSQRRDRARQLREEADRLRDQAADELRVVVREAHASGMSVRELAVALGVSHQRAQQILAESRGRRLTA
jgi:hypothetical protein